MLSTLKTKSLCRNLLLTFTLSIFFSCQKDLSLEDGGTVVTPPDLSTKINSSVSGFVTDENDAAVKDATVQFGTSTITTDKYGYFEAKNVQVVKEAAAVTVNKTGYFKGFKTYMAKEGKVAFFRIKLIPKTTVGNINAASGGTVTLANGLSIKLPAGGIVNPATNATYTGTVNVAACWINPTAADLNKIMPGDLRGINTAGSLKLLQTFGMAAVELTGASGELLQIANGQKATLTLPIPSSLSGSAPATIPLWYFDEANGLWKQEGSATKTGNTYVGDVSHFSFWNCDVPNNYVQFNCTLKNSSGDPLPYTLVKITVVGTNNSGWGYTDATGYVGGAIPDNANLVLEVMSYYNCLTPIYSQTFTTTNVNISLGIITVPAANNIATLNGTLTNCASTPVTNGYIIMLEGGTYTRYPVSNTGTYSFTRVFCSFPQSVILIGEDVANTQQSNPVTYSVNAGVNTVGNIQACGVTTQEFVNYSVNGTNFSLAPPTDTLLVYGTSTPAIIIQAGQVVGNNSASLSFVSQGIGLGSMQSLTFFGTQPQMTNPTIQGPIFVNITEYGAIGQFISGNFSGIIIEAQPPNTVYNITCSFRVRRTF